MPPRLPGLRVIDHIGHGATPVDGPLGPPLGRVGLPGDAAQRGFRGEHLQAVLYLGQVRARSRPSTALARTRALLIPVGDREPSVTPHQPRRAAGEQSPKDWTSIGL